MESENIMFSPKTLLLSLLLLTFCAFTPIIAQTSTATLSGAVQDENGAVIPGATISIADVAKGIKREATTNESGSFTFPLLPPGEYTLLVRHTGFASVQVPHVILNVGDQKALSIGLKVGDVNAAIEVRPDETLVSTSPAVGATIDRTFVQNLPLNGRSFQSLILLTPGVVMTPDNVTRGNFGQFSVNGQRQNANYFTVDGVSANVAVNTQAADANSMVQAGSVPGFSAFGGTSNLVSVDALEEFKIQTSSYSAEFGRQPVPA